jgi:hypothetical protein
MAYLRHPLTGCVCYPWVSAWNCDVSGYTSGLVAQLGNYLISRGRTYCFISSEPKSSRTVGESVLVVAYRTIRRVDDLPLVQPSVIDMGHII